MTMRPRTSQQVRALVENRATTRPRNAAPSVTIDGTTASIRLFDPISASGEWWGMSANELADVVDDLSSSISTIRLLINSPGGDVFDGIAIMNTLRDHSARIVALVQGLAASAASFIAVSADETIMAPNSEMMIHNPFGVCVGDGNDMRTFADVLDRLGDNIASIYTAKAGGTRSAWLERMAAETWYTAQEAVDIGLADTVAEPSAADATNLARNATNARRLADLQRQLDDATSRDSGVDRIVRDGNRIAAAMREITTRSQRERNERILRDLDFATPTTP